MTGSDTMTKRDKRSDGDYQRAVGDFVHREVIYCVSSCGLVGWKMVEYPSKRDRSQIRRRLLVSDLCSGG
jgi:hypothetical protein